MDTKTLEKFKHNFTQIYPCPSDAAKENAWREACRSTHNALNRTTLDDYDYWKAILMVNGKESSPEYTIWKKWLQETYDRLEGLYTINPLAVMKHVDEGGIGEDFYLEEV